MAGTEAHNPDKTYIRDVKQQVAQVRAAYWSERISAASSVSEAVHHELAQVAIVYRDALVDFRREKTLRPPWDERGLDWIMEYVDETVAVPEPTAGFTSSRQHRQVPAITQIDHRRIYRLTKELDQVYHDLGLGPEVNPDERPTGKIPYDGEAGDE